MSLMEGFSQLGANVAKSAGNALDLLQKSDAAMTLQDRAQIFTGGENDKNRAAAVDLLNQKAEKEKEAAILADRLARETGSFARQEAGQIQANAPTDAQKNENAGVTARLRAFEADQAREKEAATTARTAMTVNAEPDATKNARARAKMTPEEKAAQDELMPGRARFSYQPTTQADPDNPGATRSGVLKLDTHGLLEPEFINTGTDPNKPGSGGLGNRAEIYFKRMVSAATLATEAAHNIMELPSSSSTGFFGGRHQGGSLMSAIKEVLTNTATTQEVQDYNVMVAGVARNLSAIESSGLAPTGAFTKSMDAAVLKEGDSYLTKLRKMAEIRQIVVSGMEPNLADPKIPMEQKKQLLDVIDKMKKAIPFTHSDITALQNAKNPSATLADVMKQNGLGQPKAALPSQDTDMPTLPPGFRIIQ